MASGPSGSDITDEEIAGLTDAELVEASRSRLRESERLAEVARLRVVVDQAWATFERIRAERRNQTFAPYRETNNQFYLSVCIPFSHEFSPRRESIVWPLSSLKIQLLRRILPAGIDVPQSRAWFLRAEILRRLGEMLRTSRMGLDLTQQQVSRRSNTNIERIQAAEEGSDSEVDPQLFERACTERGFGPNTRFLSNSPWFPLLDYPYCRTIRNTTVEPAWLSANDGVVVMLARSIRDGRALDLLPILGDALEEAGCTDLAILVHCREPGPHARGCWVVDALVRAGRPG